MGHFYGTFLRLEKFEQRAKASRWRVKMRSRQYPAFYCILLTSVEVPFDILYHNVKFVLKFIFFVVMTAVSTGYWGEFLLLLSLYFPEVIL
jgi:hypothetical protein